VAAARTSQCTLDIGANTGVYAMTAVAVGCPVVHAFEPLARIRAQIDANAALSGMTGLQTWQVCVGEREGEVDLVDPGGDAPTSASASPTFVQSFLRGATGMQRVVVPMVNVHSFCQRECIERVDLMKIDVEGFEAEVLAGARTVIEKCRPRILLEALEPVSPELRRELDALRGLGYEIVAIDEGPAHASRNLWLAPRDDLKRAVTTRQA
jgi:FkbM family methyltransferase